MNRVGRFKVKTEQDSKGEIMEELKIGKYEIRLGSDEKGRTIYSLYDTEAKELLPGYEMSMSAAMIKAAQLQLDSNE